MKLVRIRQVVDDYPAALRFYGALLDGWRFNHAPNRDVCHIWSGEDGAELELVSMEAAVETLGEQMAVPGTSLRFFTRDVEAAFARMRAAGAEVVDELQPYDAGGGYGRFRAPDGTIVELSEPVVATIGTPIGG